MLLERFSALFHYILCGWLYDSGSQSLWASEAPRGLVQTNAKPSLRVSDAVSLGRAWSFVYLISFQVILILLAWGPYLEKPGSWLLPWKLEDLSVEGIHSIIE